MKTMCYQKPYRLDKTVHGVNITPPAQSPDNNVPIVINVTVLYELVNCRYISIRTKASLRHTINMETAV